MRPVLLLETILIFCSIWNFGSGRFRRKRIIEGKYGLDRQQYAYPAIRYTVWVGSGTIKPNWGFILNDPLKPDRKHARCGGVLLTPSIIQTSCTCIAFFYVTDRSRGGGYITPARPITVWEHLLQIFVGETDLENMIFHFLAKHYFVYEKCRKIELPTYSEFEPWAHYISYDYGLMVLEKEVTEAPLAQINYAPSSSFEDIIQFYHLALEKEYVCLFFGWGYFEKRDINNDYGYGNNSLILLTGWRPLLSFQNCYLATIADTVHMDAFKESELDYHDDATWVCAIAYGARYNPLKFTVARADRGGPVTCNNEYFGVISTHFSTQLQHLTGHPIRPFVEFNLYSPIVYTIWENSVNYRERFIKDTMKKVSGQTWPDPFDIVINWRPTFPLQFDSESHYSQSPKISSSLNYILLFVQIFCVSTST